MADRVAELIARLVEARGHHTFSTTTTAEVDVLLAALRAAEDKPRDWSSGAMDTYRVARASYEKGNR